MSDDQGWDIETQNHVGWRAIRSITMELDVALASLRNYAAGASMPAEFADLLRAIPEEWRADMPPVLRDTRGLVSMLEYAAYLAGVLEEGEYSRATLAIRDLTPETALQRLREAARPFGLEADSSLSTGPQLVDLGVRFRMVLLHQVGLEAGTESNLARDARQEFERILTFLRGGPQHAQFWFWLDRFYFSIYHEWSQSRQRQIDQEIARLVAALGALESHTAPPALDWLPAQNPVRRFPELSQAVQTGRTELLFWVEPFGLADFWGAYPGQLLASFAPPGAMFENFEAEAADVAERVKALADPTRLIILRIIRHFGMVNTDIAEYMELSRPTVSIHAKILREAGLIRSEQVGREMRHEIVPGAVRRLFKDLETFLDLPEDERSRD